MAASLKNQWQPFESQFMPAWRIHAAVIYFHGLGIRKKNQESNAAIERKNPTTANQTGWIISVPFDSSSSCVFSLCFLSLLSRFLSVFFCRSFFCLWSTDSPTRGMILVHYRTWLRAFVAFLLFKLGYEPRNSFAAYNWSGWYLSAV